VDFGVDALPRRPGFGVPGGEDNFIYDEGEPLADRGGRMILHPRLARPLRLFDSLELYPEVGYRQLLYHTEAQDFAEQGHVTARLDLTTRFSGDFDLGPVGRVSHVVEPLLGWSLLSHVSGRNDPVFVPASAQPQYRLRQLERENVLLDPSDRVNSRNTITLGVANRFYRRGQHLANLALSVDYNWVGKGTDYAHLVLEGDTRRVRWFESRFNLTVDTANGDIDEGLFSANVYPWKDWFLVGGSYRYREEMPRFAETIAENPWPEFRSLNQVDGRFVVFIGERWALSYSATYDLEGDELLRNGGGVEYRSKCRCWAAGVTIQDDRRDGVRFQFRYSILGLGDDRLKSNPITGTGAKTVF
jgi:hypothetical protein